MGFKEKYLKFIVGLGYDGWFSLFLGSTIVLIMAPFLPMLICAVFGLGLPWFIEGIQWFYYNVVLGIEKKQTIKIPIMSLIGSIIGVCMSYLWVMKQITEIAWF